MDNVIIEPGMLRGTVAVPPSKSAAHRAVIAAALSGGECVIENAVLSQDIEATLRGVSSLGCKHRYNSKTRTLTLAPKAQKPKRRLEIDCGESGSTLRFMIPIALTFSGSASFIGHGRLMKRPMEPYFEMFKKHGIEYRIQDNVLEVSGGLKSGEYEIAGNISSQFITGLLFALPRLDGDSVITVTTEAESKGYIDMTLDILKDFGIEIENRNYRKYIIKGNQEYKPRNYTLEGDYSQAAFFLVAGAIGNDIECVGLSENSLQGDREIVGIIERVGGIIEKTPNGIRAKHTSNMHGIEIDVSEIPDLVPILAVLFAFCKGESRILNAGRLRMKESDRLAAVSGELSHMGVNIEEGADSLKIIGGQTVNGVCVSSRGDHRIAMAEAIAACRAEGEQVCILNALSAVAKSYPDFFDVYNGLKI